MSATRKRLLTIVAGLVAALLVRIAARAGLGLSELEANELAGTVVGAFSALVLGQAVAARRRKKKTALEKIKDHGVEGVSPPRGENP